MGQSKNYFWWLIMKSQPIPNTSNLWKKIAEKNSNKWELHKISTRLDSNSWSPVKIINLKKWQLFW